MIRSDLPIARGGAQRASGGAGAEPQLGEAHDHDKTGLGAPVMEPSAATKAEIERRRSGTLRFWVLVAAFNLPVLAIAWTSDIPPSDRLILTAIAGTSAGLLLLVGLLLYCRVNLLTIYERGIAPPYKPRLTFERRMDFHVPFTSFSRIEVEDNDVERKEIPESIWYRFTFHFAEGSRPLVLTPSILGRDPSKQQMLDFYSVLKEALGSSAPDRVELRKVFPDGQRPVAAVSAARLRLRVGLDMREFTWDKVHKLRIGLGRPGSGSSFTKFDLLVGEQWVELDARQIPELPKSDIITLVEEILRIARALKIEILQEGA